MTRVRKSVLTLGGLVLTAGLTFGAPIHWPKFHHKAKKEQPAATATTKKQKKSHHLFHHGKKSAKASKPNSN